jgi:hypothetical protein
MYNFIDGDFFESLADFSFGDMYSKNLSQPSYDIVKKIFEEFDEPIIFIETHRLGSLFTELNRFLNRECSIIAHNSDATFGADILNYIPKNVKKIWCQNYNYIENDKIKSLPIGLERVRWFPEQKKQEVIFSKLNRHLTRDQLVYMNFDPKTNPQRIKIFNEIKDKNFINIDLIGNGGNYESYTDNLLRHKFIISPPGNGIDCHRNWESLMLGCIPIVLDSYFSKNMFRDAPVLIVDDYSKLNQDFLFEQYDKLSNKSYELKYNKYWENVIYETN